MTLTQLSAFVLVARLGSVKAAATVLGVSEPAVSQALAALRTHLGDQLLSRGGSGMTLTAGGNRLLSIATQMVALGAEAEAAVRASQGAPEQLRVIATSTIAEFVATPLVDAFTRRAGGGVEASCGVAAGAELPVLVTNRLADLALGPAVTDPDLDLVSEPVFRCHVIVVAAGRFATRGGALRQLPWLVDPTGTDPGSDTSRLLQRLGVGESQIRVFPNQTAAWAAAADGAGLAPAIAHLVAHRIRRGELSIVDTPVTPMETCWHATVLPTDRRSVSAGSLRRFLGTPEAMQLMRAPGTGVPPSRFRPPVYVTIWN